MKKVLTIAGSDSGGGAGIQADLKTFAARGVFGMSAVTALTAQNTMGVQNIFEIDPEFVAKQIDSVMSDIGADAWKTGMLANQEIIRVVAEKVEEYQVKNFVVDPVMIAKSGDSLIQPEAQKSILSDLLPLSQVITPNHYEAQALTGTRINSLEDARKVARNIYDLGALNVVVKNVRITHIDKATDILYDGKDFVEYSTPRIITKHVHGSGCTFASAIAAEIAKGNDIRKAVHIAKAYLTSAMIAATDLEIGKKHGPLNHSLGKSVDVDLKIVSVKSLN